MSAALAARPPPEREAPLTVAMSLDETLRIAREHEGANRRPEAESVLRRVLDVAPAHADALHLSDIVAYKAGRHTEALAYMQAAIAHGIDTPL